MELTKKFGYFCDVTHFKITEIMTDNILGYRFLELHTISRTHINNMYPHKGLSSLIWQCFPCNLTYQIKLISLTSLLQGERQISWDFPGTLGNFIVTLWSKRIHFMR